MMVDRQLLGCYRQGSEMYEVWDTNLEFVDRGNSNSCYVATVVPLGLIKNENPWMVTEDFDALPESLRMVLQENMLFITDPKANSRWGVLMYVPKDNPKMSRVGVLLDRQSGSWQVVRAEIDGQAYAIEIKGVGSGTGGFPDLHRRRQAGTEHFHVRITGGMGLMGAIKEFKGLESVRSTFDKRGSCLRAVAIAQFQLSGEGFREEMASLIRLTPSSIRLGFSGHPIFDNLNDFRLSVFAKAAGKEVARFLNLVSPAIHRNVGWANMVYVGPEEYILSDYEELGPVADWHCNLETPETILPFFLLNYPFRVTEFDAFSEGFQRTYLGINLPDKLDAENLNRNLFEKDLGGRVFRERIHRQNKSTPPGLVENVMALRGFLGEDYLRMPLREWVDTELVPSLERQKAALLAGEGGEAHPSDASEDRFGKYLFGQTMAQQFLKPVETEFDRRERVDALTNFVQEAKQFLKEGNCPPISRRFVTGLFFLRNHWRFIDLHMLLFPYLPWVATWYENENRVLRGAMQTAEKLTVAEHDVLATSIKELERRQKILRATPEYFRNLLIAGDEAFIAALMLPY